MKTLILSLSLLFTSLLASVAAPHPSLPAIGSLDGLGANIHFTELKPGELEMIKAAGFNWVRTDLTWAATERKPGEYDFRAYDSLVSALEKNGLRAVFILDYGNKLYDDGLPPHTDEGRSAFARWAAAAVGHYAGKGYLWELWNEPNIAQFWKPKPDVQQYIALAKAVSAELRRAKLTPGECLIGPATSTVDLPFLEACCKAGLLEIFDGISVHPYRQNPPETVEKDYRAIRLLTYRYGAKDRSIPILSSEWGYSSASESLGKDESTREKVQGSNLARMFLTNIANDVPLSIWYDWRDDGDDAREPEHRFGLVRRKYREGEKQVFEPKPAFTAMSVLAEELRGFRFNKTLGASVDQMNPKRVFSKGNTIKVTGWSRKIFDPKRKPEWTARLLDGSTKRDNAEEEAQFDQPELPVAVDDAKPPEPAPFSWSYEAPNFFTPEGEETIAAYSIMANWPRLPEQLIVQAPARVEWPLEVSNTSGMTMDFDIGGSQQDMEVIAFCGTGASVEPPLYTFAPGESFRARRPISISTYNRGQEIGSWISLRTPSGEVLSFQQHSVVDVVNAIDLQLVSSTPQHAIIQIRKLLGEKLIGVLTVGFSEREVNSHRELEVPANVKETLVAVPIPTRYDNFNSPFDPLRWGRTRLAISNADGHTIAFANGGVAIHQPDLVAARKLRTSLDGDPAVIGDITLEDSSPREFCPEFRSNTCRLGYRFSKGWKFGAIAIKAGVPHSIPKREDSFGSERQPRAFRLWVKGDGKGCQARIRFKDSTGQVFQSDGAKIDFNDWHQVEFPISTEVKPPHWGGANDGQIHWPIEWESLFLLDNVSKEPVEGEIYISAPTLNY